MMNLRRNKLKITSLIQNRFCSQALKCIKFDHTPLFTLTKVQIKIVVLANQKSFSTMEAVNGLKKKVPGDSFDEWKRVPGHTFTAGFVVESLRSNDEIYKKLHGERPVKDVTASDISKGKGFASEILRCTIHFVDSTSESDVYTTVLKIPGMKSMEAVADDTTSEFILNDGFTRQIAKFHQTEIDFYEHVIKTLDVPVARVFKTLPWNVGESQGILHMEDMTGKGISFEFTASLTIPQIKEIVRNLAHMHSKCLTSEDEEFHSWKGKHNDNPLFPMSTCSFLGNTEPFLEICGERNYIEPLINKYKKFATNPEYIQYAVSQSWKDLNMSPVVVHGDFDAGNLMWKLDENGEMIVEVAALIDWQLSYEGSPMADLARLLTFSTDGWVRRQAEELIFDFYHDQLEKEMKKVGKSCPYTVDQIKKAYNYIYLMQCYGMVIMPNFLKEMFKEDSPRLRQAKIDTVILRAKHILEDMDRLLSGEMKDVYEKYGL